MTFVGSYLHNVDKKGRIFIPAKFREGLGDGFYIALPIDGQECLTIYPMERWEEIQRRIDALPIMQQVVVQRQFVAMAAEAECDAQGRVLIPSILRSYAHIEDSAYVVGTNSTIEIWAKDSWDQRMSEMSSASFASVMNQYLF